LKSKLRIGLLVNGYKIPAWKYRIIDQIHESEYAEIVCVIVSPVPEAAKGKGKHVLTSLLIRSVEVMDRLIFRTGNDYNAIKDISALVKDLPVLDHEPITGKESIENLRMHNPDIVIKFGQHNLSGEILRLPGYGVWGYSADGKKTFGITEPGLREVINYRPVTYSSLEIQNENPVHNNVIFETWESTCPFSINVNRNRINWRTALFLPRILYGLYKYQDNYLERLKHRFHRLRPEFDPGMEVPAFLKVAKNITRYFIRVIRLSLGKLYYTNAFSWELFYNINRSRNCFFDNKNYKVISPPPELFWADPFVVHNGENYFVFAEEFIYRKDKAHISVLKLDYQGNLLESRKVIERPYHMSYPFIFTIGSAYYMIPETCQNSTIELYKCTEFPWKWQFEKNIMENLNAADTTLFNNNGKWWLFTSIDQTDNISGSSTELFLFYTDDVLIGEWKSHPMNPVVSDVRNARPAGSLFIQNDKIYRPSQDCSMRYGRGLNLNLVTVLTEKEYHEERVTRIKPSWNKKLRGMHTINFDNGLTMVDVYSFHKRISFDFRVK